MWWGRAVCSGALELLHGTPDSFRDQRPAERCGSDKTDTQVPPSDLTRPILRPTCTANNSVTS